MVKLGCDITDYEETLLIPLMNSIPKAEEDFVGNVTILIDEQKLVAYAQGYKSTIEKIKAKEKLSLNGSVSLEIDEFKFDLNFKGLIYLSNPFYYPNVRVCFGKSEICDQIRLDSQIFFPWFLTKILIEKEARIVMGQLELKLSIKGDLGSVLDKVLREEEFQADLQLKIDSDESYGWVHYQGKTSTSKFSTMIEDMMYPYRKNYFLEYLYVKADEISASICADYKCFSARGCSEDLCNSWDHGHSNAFVAYMQNHLKTEDGDWAKLIR